MNQNAEGECSTPKIKGKIKDLTGMIFGRLTVLGFAFIKRRKSHFNCMCICKTEIIVAGTALIHGNTKSCGCLMIELARNRITHGHSRRHSASSEYISWKTMKDRCLRKKHKDWKDYGGRGITIDPAWMHDFPEFLKDMGPKPSPLHSIHRIDNDLGYTKSNCVWALPIIQANCKRNNHFVTYNGQTKTLAQWGRISGLSQDTIRSRLRLGWSVDDVFTKPLRFRHYWRDPRRLE